MAIVTERTARYTFLIFIIFVLAILITWLIKPDMLELFSDDSSNSSNSSRRDGVIPEVNLFNDPSYEKNRTLLYGSLFLDKLNEQIKGMTDPAISYDTKRIDIIKYSDILL